MMCHSIPVLYILAYDELSQGNAQTYGGPAPINMGEPCLDNVSVPCYQSIDITRPVTLMSHGAVSVRKCTVQLLPWSPFPCKFDPAMFNATPGQPTDLCTKELSTEDFLGTMPNIDQICLKMGRQLLGAKFSLKFKVAQGRQYDRSYSMHIKNAIVSPTVFSYAPVSTVLSPFFDSSISIQTFAHTESQVAVGTTTEPTYYPPSSGGGEKRWSTERDITHLQSIFLPGSPVHFRLGNLLTNDYYVPVWASAEIELLYGRSPEIPPELESPNEVLPLWTAASVQGTGGG